MSSKVDAKVVLLGMHDVGKTCLVERYLHGNFKETVTATVGAAFGAKKVEVNGTIVTLGIWDTAGAERYESMSKIYYRSARAAIICFDLTNLASFDKVQFWIDELSENEGNCDIYIVGTKVDLVKEGIKKRDVEQRLVEDIARTTHADYFETSAKTGENISNLFEKIAKDYLKKKPEGLGGKINNNNNNNNVTNLNNNNQHHDDAKSGGCC